MTSPTLVAEVRQSLAGFAPFSRFETEDLDFLARRVELAYYRHGETIVGPGDDVPDACYIVRQGVVEALRADRPDVPTVEDILAGESFPVGALVMSRPTTTQFRAAGDVFCWRLARADFDALYRRSAVWRDFATRRLGVLLEMSRAALQASHAQETAWRREASTPLADVMSAPAVTARADEALRPVFERMESARVGSIIVVPQAGANPDAVTGIFTHRDLIGRVVLPCRPLHTPIGEVMSRPVTTIDAGETVADAILLMAGQGIRHLPVLRDGRLAGMVTERDLFALHRRSMRRIGDLIAASRDEGDLARAADDLRAWAGSLVAQGAQPAFVTGLVSRLNDQVARRLIAIAAANHAVDLARVCWLAFGSEGREEQTIATDQDNGLVLPDDGSVDPARAADFAREVNEALARCGFPLCQGDIMASNPAWRTTLGQWKARFAGWVDRGDPQALLEASIFFDFRGLAGDTGLATHLRDYVTERARGNRRFLKQMAEDALRTRVPGAWAGGLFDGLIGDGATGSIDLKRHGTRPFVDAARVLALATGVRVTGTVGRLAGLVDAGRIGATEAGGWIDAFQFLQGLRLRLQTRSGQVDPNLLDTRRLSRLDARILREALRQARRIQQRVELEFPG